MGVGLTKNMESSMWGGEMVVHPDSVDQNSLTFSLLESIVEQYGYSNPLHHLLHMCKEMWYLYATLF